MGNGYKVKKNANNIAFFYFVIFYETKIADSDAMIVKIWLTFVQLCNIMIMHQEIYFLRPWLNWIEH